MHTLYIMNLNVVMNSKESSSVVLYLRPLQLCSSNLHDIMQIIREQWLPYHLKHSINNYISASLLYYYINIIKVDDSDFYSEWNIKVKLSNIRGYKKYYDRYLKLRDYICDRGERRKVKEENEYDN